MNTGSKIQSIALLVVLMVLSSCGDTSPILVGFSGQLTGKNSELGVHGRNGAMLAVEILNTSGGINGRPLKLIAEDDLNSPAGAVAADRKLINKGVVAIIGHMTSSQTMAVIPLMKEHGMVYIAPSTTTPTLSGLDDTFFRVIVDNSVHAKELAEYTRSALDINTVISFADTDNEAYSATFVDSFDKTFSSLGGTILKQITYSSRQKANWDSIIDALIEFNPGAILLACPAQDAASLVQRVRAAGLSTKIISGPWAYTGKIIQWGGPFVENMIFSTNHTGDNPNPAFVKFKGAYTSRFGVSPNFAAVLGYESILALAQGLKKTDGKTDGLAHAIAYSGLINGIIDDFEMDKYGDVKRNIYIVTVQDNEFRTIELR